MRAIDGGPCRLHEPGHSSNPHWTPPARPAMMRRRRRVLASSPNGQESATMRRRALPLAASLAVTLALPLLAQDKPRDAEPRYAGATETGFLLPNGWTLSP